MSHVELAQLNISASARSGALELFWLRHTNTLRELPYDRAGLLLKATADPDEFELRLESNRRVEGKTLWDEALVSRNDLDLWLADLNKDDLRQLVHKYQASIATQVVSVGIIDAPNRKVEFQFLDEGVAHTYSTALSDMRIKTSIRNATVIAQLPWNASSLKD